MIVFLHGEDSFLVNRRKVVLQKGFMKKYPTGEVFVFDFEDQSESSFVKQSLSVCEPGLFETKKLAFFLHSSALDETREKGMIEFVRDFSTKKSEDVTVCFIESGKIKKTQGIIKALLAYKDTEEIFPKKEVRNIGVYIEEELHSIDDQARFSREALQVFAKLLQDDTARIHTELEKLSLYKPGEVFEKEDVLLLVSGSAEEVIFEALDALGNRERGRALFLFHKQGMSREGVYPLFGLCAGQVRRMLLVREMIDRGIRQQSEIATHTKIHPFVVQKILGIIAHFPLERVKKGLVLLSSLDSAVKQGEKDPLVALDMFLWKF